MPILSPRSSPLLDCIFPVRGTPRRRAEAFTAGSIHRESIAVTEGNTIGGNGKTGGGKEEALRSRDNGGMLAEQVSIDPHSPAIEAADSGISVLRSCRAAFRPFSAAVRAAISPAGPAPTTEGSYRLVICHSLYKRYRDILTEGNGQARIPIGKPPRIGSTKTLFRGTSRISESFLNIAGFCLAMVGITSARAAPTSLGVS